MTARPAAPPAGTQPHVSLDATRAGLTRIRRPGGAQGLALGALGVLGFSFSLPATKLAVEGLDPWFVAFGRATVAAILAAGFLAATGAPRPSRSQWRRLAVVAGGVVVGFPLFSTLALQTSGAAHGAVVVALLPAATAAFAVLRARERPSPTFWAAALAGLVIVAGYAIVREHGALSGADGLFLAAVITCAFGYAEGGALARELGGARTICWALVLSALPSAAIAAVAGASGGFHASADAWLGFAYVSVISMLLAFFAWYAGLARGGVARVSQVQLAQPLLTILWSGAVLGEAIGAGTLLAAAGALACVALTQRARVRGAP
jgi:drug/metabolite transporter (DMT)-like permease